MLGFFYMGVQIVKIVQPGRVLVVLDDGQLTGLGEPSQLARAHAEVQSRLFRSQQPSRNVICYSHCPRKIRHNLGTAISRPCKLLIPWRLERRKEPRRIINPLRLNPDFKAKASRTRSIGPSLYCLRWDGVHEQGQEWQQMSVNVTKRL